MPNNEQIFSVQVQYTSIFSRCQASYGKKVRKFMSINERIKNRAKDLGMTIEEVEQKCGLGKRTIYSWDKNSPAVDKVKRVADLLDTTPGYIMGWEGTNEEILERLARDEDFRAFCMTTSKCTQDELRFLEGVIKAWKK